MGSEDVDGRIYQEAKRVAATFGVEEFTCLRGYATLTNFYASEGEVSLWGSLDSRREQTMLHVLDIKKDNNRCQVSVTNVLGSLTEEDKWVLIDQAVFREEMARWLYCLGFEEETVLEQLPALSMHEQMKLRLSFSREFWPETWLDEAAAG